MNQTDSQPGATSAGQARAAETAILARSFRVGKRTCTLTIPQPRQSGVISMTAEWSPNVPRRLSRKEMRQYRAGRDDLMTDLAVHLGGAVAVAEV